MKDPLFKDIPLILETPVDTDDIYAKEIKILKGKKKKWKRYGSHYTLF